MKKALWILGIAATAFAALFLPGRYGWRIAGFSGCDAPGQNFVESVTEDGGRLTVRGGTADSMSACVGYITELRDGRLYLGVRHNALFGFFRRLGGFSVSVERAERITEIYLKGASGERLVWTRETGLVRSVPAQQPSDGASEDAPAA